jgi:hypothetical protein
MSMFPLCFAHSHCNQHRLLTCPFIVRDSISTTVDSSNNIDRVCCLISGRSASSTYFDSCSPHDHNLIDKQHHRQCISQVRMSVVKSTTISVAHVSHANTVRFYFMIFISKSKQEQYRTSMIRIVSRHHAR